MPQEGPSFENQNHLDPSHLIDETELDTGEQAIDLMDEVEQNAKELSESQAEEEILAANDILDEFGMDAQSFLDSGVESDELLKMAAAIKLVRTGSHEALGIVGAFVDQARDLTGESHPISPEVEI